MHRQVLKIKIWDNGPGVPIEIRNNLFDPLITGRPQGTGLGLSITQEIVQRHKGVVQLESHHGKTCFSIYLPYIDEIRPTSSPNDGE
jgi:two-component system nitrogen regulation sensor histidine kinase GlnL